MEDPEDRVPPIPTVIVRAPGTPREQALLCYTDSVYTATEAHVDAAMRAVYDGVLRLEAALPADSPVRSVQVRQCPILHVTDMLVH